MTATAEDRHRDRVCQVITHEFGRLHMVSGPGLGGRSISHGELLRAESSIKMALNGKGDLYDKARRGR